MTTFRKLLCLILCLVCLPFCPVHAEDPASISIRVLLKRLNLTDRADLYLEGTWTAETENGTELAFQHGTALTVQIRKDQLYCFCGDITFRAGNRLKLNRGNAEAILRFEKNGRYYPGDLCLTVSGGQLEPILTLDTERYLQGVVPYEMSDNFPLEALKAQAVCARTYAISKRDPSKAYDVVDTTNDQVFMGLDHNHANSDKAISETAGVVCTYRNALAICYYAASNGGQTELPGHVWAGPAQGGYTVTEDPYDVENPESIVLKATLKKDGKNLNTELLAMLREAAAGEIAAQEYLPETFQIDRIDSICLHTPRNPETDKQLTKMDITFSWSGRKLIPVETPLPPVADNEDMLLFTTATPSPVPDVLPDQPTATPLPAPTPRLSDYLPADSPLTVTLSLFPDLIRTLSLSVYGADNEIVTVVDTGDAFRLESRRYGHGVGMSQRGAQWMAGHYGKSFSEILSFYYPGMELKKMSVSVPALPTPDPDLIHTPGPAATPTPRPTLMPVSTANLPDGAWIASVENIEDDSSLNLRAEPSPAGEILRRLYKHQQLIVLETCEDPEWVHVRTDAMEGYVKVSFLEKIP